ncbi:MAG: glycosyltransferase [Kiloniellales bacterium]
MNDQALEARRVCIPFPGDTVGGSHLSALLLARSLPARYRAVIVLHQEGRLARLLHREDIGYELLPLPAGYVGSRKGALGHAVVMGRNMPPLLRFLRRHRIDLVHGHDGRVNQTWAIPARLAGRAVIWHQRSKHRPSRLAGASMRRAHRVIAISRFVAASLPPLPDRHVRVVANPCDLDAGNIDRRAARAALAGELNCAPERPLIAFVGNMTEQKRPGIFVECAARILKDGEPQPLFLLFGADRDGRQARLEARAAELSLGDRIRFMGFRNPAERVIAGCDLLIAPAVEEGFGRTLIEAMTVGTPIVAARSGGHVEALDDGRTGVLVPADDASAFAAASSALLVDPARAAAMAERAKQDALSRFSVERHVERICAIYDEVLHD